MADPTAQRIWNTALGQLQLYPTRSGNDDLDSAQNVRGEPANIAARVLTERTTQ